MKSKLRFLVVLLGMTVAHAYAQDAAPAETVAGYVALTFDDGPSQMMNPALLKMLSDRHIKATFFSSGETVQSHPDIVKKEVAEGHEVGSRSWTNSGLSTPTDDTLRGDLMRTDKAFKMAIGRSPAYFSPLSLNFTPQQCEWVEKDFGYKVVFWTVDASAVKTQPPAAIAQYIIGQTKPGSIIMASEIHSPTVQAMPMVLDTLISKGYKFVTVTELQAMNGGGTKPVAQARKKPVREAAPQTAPPTQGTGGGNPYGTVRTPPGMAP